MEVLVTATVRPDENVKRARVDAMAALQAKTTSERATSNAAKMSRYKTMRKIMPEGAVRQRMEADGVSAEDLAAFWES